MTARVPVSGFSIVRNAVRYGYPVGAALRSIAPLVEELVVAVGNSDDGTRELIAGLGIPQLRIIDTVWDESLRRGGLILSQQTNVALAECRHPWAFYIQADEAVHEDDYPKIEAALDRWKDDRDVDALRFRFLHFEGTYAYVNYVRYRKQNRIIRNNGEVYSVGDAAGFARRDGRKLRIRKTGATIYHYGWARAPEVLRTKTIAFQKLYHDDRYVAEHYEQVPAEYLSDVDIAFRYRGTHPAVMRDLIGGTNWQIPKARRPPLDTPLLNPRFYAAWLRKWRILPRVPGRGPGV
jgi:glycosyltransferase involved in cell wall biosynthesis